PNRPGEVRQIRPIDERRYGLGRSLAGFVQCHQGSTSHGLRALDWYPSLASLIGRSLSRFPTPPTRAMKAAELVESRMVDWRKLEQACLRLEHGGRRDRLSAQQR